MNRKDFIKLLCLFCISLLLCTSLYGKQTIKVLAIGNSFSADALESYLWNLGAAADVEFVIGNAFIGGCSLNRHWDCASGDLSCYSYRKIENGEKKTLSKQTLAFCIKDEKWDVISFQQVSSQSGMYESYFPYLNDLLDYVKAMVSNPKVKYVLHQTWAYAKSPIHKSFVNYDNDQMKMYEAIVDAVWRVAETVGFETVIPSGTAIQNGRSSVIGDNFNRDASHLSYGIGRYTAACTWFEVLTGISVVGNAYKPECITDFQCAVAQNAAHLAVNNPRSISDMSFWNGEESFLKNEIY